MTFDIIYIKYRIAMGSNWNGSFICHKNIVTLFMTLSTWTVTYWWMLSVANFAVFILDKEVINGEHSVPDSFLYARL